MIGFVMSFEENSNVPKYIQLYETVKGEISDGSFTQGEKLPSVRMVSKSLGISKSTVENAYNQLVVEGYIEGVSKSGYYVTAFDAYALNLFSRKTVQKNTQKSTKDDQMQTFVPLFNTDGTEESAFNFNEWKKAINRVLEYDTKALLSYGDVQGEYSLRKEIADFVHQSRGGRCQPNQIIVGAGIQFLFGLIATLFRGQQQQIAFEYPGFSKGMYIFEDYGYQTIKVPVESDGIDIKILEASKAKIVYVSPSHQYPTGSIMSIKKRVQLINWASKNNAFIIEDDYDSLLRYEGYPVPALQGLNYGRNVIYVGSFSKLLIPSLRISFMILPEPLLEVFNGLKQRYSQSVSKIEQLALAGYMMDGYFERHIRRIKKIYGKKNQLLIDAFKRYSNPYIQLIGKDSGLHVMLAFHEDVDTRKIVSDASKLGIMLEGVDDYVKDHILVLSYSGIPDEMMDHVISQITKITIDSLHHE